MDNNYVIEEKDNKFLAWGIILNVLGVSISIILKEVTGNDSSIVTNSVLGISILLIIDWKSIFLSPRLNKSITCLLIFILQMYIICSAILVDAPLLNSSNALIYTIYVVAFFFALMTNHDELDEQYTMRCILVITAILNIIAFILIIRNGGTLYSLNESVVSMEGGAERSTLSGIPFYFIIAFLTTSQETGKNKIWWIFFAISLINMFACNRRTVYLSVLACLLLVIVKRPFINLNITKKKLMRLILAIVVFFLVYKILDSIPWVNSLINSSVESLNRGISTFFSNEYEDASVLIRNHNRAIAINTLKENSMSEWIFGRGYAFQWIDFPILEAVLDLGVLMGCLYAFLFVVYPIVKIKKLKEPSDFELFVSSCMLSALLSSFSSGMPYGYTKYCPLIIFVFVIERRKSVNGSIENGIDLEVE